MEIADSLITYFGIDLLVESATFVDLLNVVLRIGVAVWLVAFIIRSLFLVCTIPGRSIF